VEISVVSLVDCIGTESLYVTATVFLLPNIIRVIVLEIGIIFIYSLLNFFQSKSHVIIYFKDLTYIVLVIPSRVRDFNLFMIAVIGLTQVLEYLAIYYCIRFLKKYETIFLNCISQVQ
jgi:hypothetical protein